MRKILPILFILFTSNFGFSQLVQDNYPSDWELYTIFEDITVEYKYKECDSGSVKNQVLVLFKFTNTSDEHRALSWTVKHYRDGDCFNCANIDSHEYMHEIDLEPGQVIMGDGTSMADDNLYLFSSFIRLVKGMPTTKLTGFEFINVIVQ